MTCLDLIERVAKGYGCRIFWVFIKHGSFAEIKDNEGHRKKVEKSEIGGRARTMAGAGVWVWGWRRLCIDSTTQTGRTVDVT